MNLFNGFNQPAQVLPEHKIKTAIEEIVEQEIQENLGGSGVIGVASKIETRTSHPTSPEVGQIWIRTDMIPSANTAPTVPTNLTAGSITNTTFVLSWTGATDSQGDSVTYDIYKAGVLFLAGVASNSMTITGQTAGSTNQWSVKAKDSKGAESALSSSISVTQTSAVSGKYIRWEFDDMQDSSAGSFIGVLELEVNSPDILPSTAGSWSASSTHSSGQYTADKVANDTKTTDAGNYYASADLQKTNQWIQCNLGSVLPLDFWKIWGVGPTGIQPKTVRVYVSEQATAPSKTYGVTSAGWSLAWSGVLPVLAVDSASANLPFSIL